MESSGWRGIRLEKHDSARMVDISDKTTVHRSATAQGKLTLKKETIDAIRGGTVMKGDPLTTGTVASILAVKKTPELIPMCHPIPVTSVNTVFHLGEDNITAQCIVTADYKTGVEMEALTGVSVALLTVWDMVKYLEKDEDGQYSCSMISEVKVVEKRKDPI